MENIDKLLNHSFIPSDIGEGMTVREYLAALLITLLEEGESFSGKRPFGNSGWEENLVIPAIECGALKGEIDRADEDWPEASGWDSQEFADVRAALVDRALGVSA
jgi:hypothetical protein